MQNGTTFVFNIKLPLQDDTDGRADGKGPDMGHGWPGSVQGHHQGVSVVMKLTLIQCRLIVMSFSFNYKRNQMWLDKTKIDICYI